MAGLSVRRLECRMQVGARRTAAPRRDAACVNQELPGTHVVLRLGGGIGHVRVAQILCRFNEQIAQAGRG